MAANNKYIEKPVVWSSVFLDLIFDAGVGWFISAVV